MNDTPEKMRDDFAVVPTRIDIRLPFPEESTEKTFQTQQEKPSSFVVEPGTIIGEYVVEEKLGEGGMGEIWRGLHPLIGKQVAIKVLRGKIASDQEAVERFIREAKAVNAIKHKALIDIFSFGDLPDGRPYFVMEYLAGESLSSYIKRRGPLPFSEILPIFLQVCEALGATHQQGIIHRDLKGDNLFLTPGKREKFHVKVLDFGIAKLLHPDQENASLTQDGDIFGTPAYMSPEQCQGTVDHRSDIYSLGIILFETLTGRTPFLDPGQKATEVLLRQLGEEPPAPSTLVKGRNIPGSVDKLVLQILSKSPQKRPQSCEELADLLQKTLSQKESELDGAKPIFLPAYKRRRGSKSVLFGAVGLLGVLVFLVGYALFLKPRESLSASAPTSTAVKQIEPPTTIQTPQEKVTLRITTPDAEVFLGKVSLGKTPLVKEFEYSETPITLSIQREGFITKELIYTPDASSVFSEPLTKIKGKVKNPGDGSKNNPNPDGDTGLDLTNDPFKQKK